MFLTTVFYVQALSYKKHIWNYPLAKYLSCLQIHIKNSALLIISESRIAVCQWRWKSYCHLQKVGPLVMYVTCRNILQEPNSNLGPSTKFWTEKSHPNKFQDNILNSCPLPLLHLQFTVHAHPLTYYKVNSLHSWYSAVKWTTI
jgi:hypothetical protein